MSLASGPVFDHDDDMEDELSGPAPPIVPLARQTPTMDAAPMMGWAQTSSPPAQELPRAAPQSGIDVEVLSAAQSDANVSPLDTPLFEPKGSRPLSRRDTDLGDALKSLQP